MKEINIPVNRIRKAQIRYFDKEHNGVEVPELKAYTIFIKMGDSYINLFNKLEDCNVYERLPYSNTTSSGESYGTKIKLVQGNEAEGMCYVLESKPMNELYGRDFISERDLYDIVLRSYDFYLDRMELLKDYPHLISYHERKDIIKRDIPLYEKVFDYFESKNSIKKIKNK